MTVDLQAAQKAEDKFQAIYDAGEAAQTAAPPQPEATPEPAPEAAPEPAVEAAPEPEYTSLDEYLTKTGVERDSFYTLPVKVKADGKDYDVPLSDLIKSYGLEKHFQEKSISFAEKQKAWEAEQAQAKQTWDKQLGNAKALANIAHQQLMADYKDVKWDELRINDPQRYLMLRDDANTRFNQIQNQLAQIQQAEAERAQQAAQEQRAVLAKEDEKLLSVIPEWRDSEKRVSETRQMREYAKSRGFTDDELNSIFDHRYMRVLREAAQLADFQSKANAAVKKVRAAPQVSNAGARVTRDPKQVAAQQAKERFMKNPRDVDAQTAYFERLAG